MEQRGVCEYAVEIRLRQIELQEILLPDVATAVHPRHHCEVFGAIETDGDVTAFAERL